MSVYAEVNTHLQRDCYRPWMPPLKRKPTGTPKGQAKPRKHSLDPKFPDRLAEAMQKYRPAPISVPELAALVGCTRAVLLKYVNGNSKSPDPLLLFQIADKLNVRLAWLVAAQLPMREVYTKEAAQIAANIDAIEDPDRRDNALKISRLATETTAQNKKVTKAYYGKHTDRLIGRYTTPTLWDEADHSEVPKGER